MLMVVIPKNFLGMFVLFFVGVEEKRNIYFTKKKKKKKEEKM